MKVWIKRNGFMIAGIILFIINFYNSFYYYDETPIGYPSLYAGQGLILLMICYLIQTNKNRKV